MERHAVSLPLEWPLVLLDKIASRGSGHTPSKKRPEYWNGVVQWVSLADTTRLDKGLVSSSVNTITPEGVAHSAAVVHRAGTVILLRGSSVGKSAVLAADMAVSQDYVTWTCGPQLDNWYLYYVLQSRKAEFARIGFGNTIKTIGLDYFKHLAIPLAPIAEQQKIAQALCSVDNMISSLERTIIKKRAIKQGMMQQLLSGRTRLPGFANVWLSGPLKEFMPLQRGFDLPASRVRNGPYPVVYSNGITRYNAEAMIQGPGVITGRSGTIGKVHFVEEDYWPHNTTLWVTSFARTDARFSYYFLAQIGLERFASGSGVPTFNRNDAHSFEIHLPSDRREQEAIAAVLVDADDEIATLRTRLKKALALKQGMMQQLLTGRTRLPV